MGIAFSDIKRNKNKISTQKFQDKTNIKNNLKRRATTGDYPRRMNIFKENDDQINKNPQLKDKKDSEINKNMEDELITRNYNEVSKALKYISVENLIKNENINHSYENGEKKDIYSNLSIANFNSNQSSGEKKNKLFTEDNENKKVINNCFDEKDEKENKEEKEEEEYDKNKEENKINRMLITNNIKKVFIDSKIPGKEKNETSFNLEKSDENSTNLGSRTSSSFSTFDYELNFYKSGNEIRESYISKLISKKIWNPSIKTKKHNSIIIFDWDDTLFPTSFITPGGIFNEDIKLSEKEKQKFITIEKSVFSLLNQAIQKGKVYIITNAGNGWVEYSANRFFPSILGFFSKIEIISAREEYEKKYPGNSRLWKIQAFLTLLENVNVKLVTNIICLGDSLFEMEAGRILASKFSKAFIKTIKFREDPKLDELIKQLNLVCNQFSLICSRIKNLTIRLEKKKKEKIK